MGSVMIVVMEPGAIACGPGFFAFIRDRVRPFLWESPVEPFHFRKYRRRRRQARLGRLTPVEYEAIMWLFAFKSVEVLRGVVPWRWVEVSR